MTTNLSTELDCLATRYHTALANVDEAERAHVDRMEPLYANLHEAQKAYTEAREYNRKVALCTEVLDITKYASLEDLQAAVLSSYEDSRRLLFLCPDRALVDKYLNNRFSVDWTIMRRLSSSVV